MNFFSEVEGRLAIESVEAYGSRAGGKFRRRGPMAESDLDLFVTIRSGVVDSLHKWKGVNDQSDEIAASVGAGKGCSINIACELDVFSLAAKKCLHDTPIIPIGK